MGILDDGSMEAGHFSRQLQLADYFRNATVDKPPFVAKSGWSPPKSELDPEIQTIHQRVMTRIRQLPRYNNKQNLSASERRALSNIRRNSKLIIKPADKGASTVLMSREDYIREAHRLLNNPKHYKKLDREVWPRNLQRFSEIVNGLQKSGYISKKQAKYLGPDFQAQTRKLYILPKIHKPHNTWPHARMPPDRPIVSDVGSESYAISEYIDYFLKPIANRHPSYLKNTQDFLSKISETKIPQNAFLATLDIDAMYTNIDLDAGITAIRKSFDKYPDEDRPDEEILELLELSVKGNDFKFGDEFYLQTCGVSMGKRFSPNFANIFVADWEEKALSKSNKQPLLYLRYLDDIFIIWQHSKEAFWDFFDILNNQDPNIRLKAEISDTSIDFLDVTVYKGKKFQNSELLDYKIFFKPTDSHQLLHSESFHPKHTFAGLIKSQIIRFYRNSSDIQNFNRTCSILFAALKPRGYSARFLRKVKAQTVRELRSYRKKEERYQPSKVHHHRPSRDMGTVKKCGKQRCKLDLEIQELSTFQSFQNKNVFHIADHLNCDSENVVYLISCTLCKKQYVGQTRNAFRIRATRHRSDINLNADFSVADHFNLPNHVTSEHFKIMPIEKTPILGTEDDTNNLRKIREGHWIKTLQTIRPFGMNEDFGISVKRKIIPFTLTYNRRNVELGKIFKEEYSLLQTRMAEPLSARPIIAYSKNKSLRDSLVHAKLSPVSDS